MGTIFSSADSVLAFVPKNEVSPQSLADPSPQDRIWAFLARMEHDASLFDCFNKRCCFGRRHESHEWNARDVIQGIIEICRSTYWRRLWIVQEIVLAKEILITNRIQLISWTTLQTALKTILRHDELSEDERLEVETSTPCRVQELRTGSRRASLMALLSDYGAFECGKFHDRVYGLLSVAINGRGLLINYTCSQLELFFATLRFCCKEGAYLTEESELFSGARTISSALRVDPEWPTNAAFSMRDVEDIECKALLSSFAIVATFDLGYHSRLLLECQQCHSRFEYHLPNIGSMLFCLVDDGAQTHLLFPSDLNSVGHPKSKANLILTAPPQSKKTESSRFAENGSERVAILSPSLSRDGLY